MKVKTFTLHVYRIGSDTPVVFRKLSRVALVRYWNYFFTHKDTNFVVENLE